jgi:transposase
MFMSQGKTRRKFTKEFKLEAVRLSEQPEKTIYQVADELGVPVKFIYRWRYAVAREGAEAFRGHGHRLAAEAELTALRRENAELRMERDILKKAAAWFAKHTL